MSQGKLFDLQTKNMRLLFSSSILDKDTNTMILFVLSLFPNLFWTEKKQQHKTGG